MQENTMPKTTKLNEEVKFDFEKDELNTWNYFPEYFIDLLNGEITLDEIRENLASFRNSKYYTGNNKKYKSIIED